MRYSVLLSALSLVACGGAESERATAHQTSTERSYNVTGFEKIALGGDSNVIVKTGGEPSVRAEGEAEQLDRLDIHVTGNTLHIDRKKGDWDLSFKSGKPITVFVTVPSLSDAAIGGSGNIEIDRAEGRQFGGSIGGSGNLQIASLRVDDASFAIAGSGDIDATGTAGSIKIDVAGSGGADLDGVAARTASVNVVGSGDVRVRASETASVSIMGSGDVTVSGPAKCSVSKAGSGDVRCGA